MSQFRYSTKLTLAQIENPSEDLKKAIINDIRACLPKSLKDAMPYLPRPQLAKAVAACRITKPEALDERLASCALSYVQYHEPDDGPIETTFGQILDDLAVDDIENEISNLREVITDMAPANRQAWIDYKAPSSPHIEEVLGIISDAYFRNSPALKQYQLELVEEIYSIASCIDICDDPDEEAGSLMHLLWNHFSGGGTAQIVADRLRAVFSK